ncbi:MAG: BMC domain-containing protein [Ruminococcus sp.]|nr:BMC domain-containing protein [Ruminococcus sp.]
MRYGAFGLVEVLGNANAVIVVDKMLKTADVVYETKDTKCGGHVLVFVSGDVSAVKAAVDEVTVSAPCKIFNSAVISNPSEEMVKIVEEFKERYK